jgi:hypothetical protein
VGRTKVLKNVARDMLDGSVFNSALFERKTSKGIERCIFEKGKVKDLPFAPYTTDREDRIAVLAAQGNLEYRGTIVVDRLPVPFYGSEKAWVALKGQE